MKLKLLKKSVFALVLASSALAFADTAKIISVTGKVEVNRKDAWVTLEKDSIINEGEVISTGFKSEALISYKDSVMKLGALTRITLEKLASSDVKDDVSIYLNTGNIRSTVNHSENKRINYTVRNPIAVASVRGTRFGFDSTGTGDCEDGGILIIPADLVDPVKDLGIKNPVGMDDKKKTNQEAGGENLTTLPPAEGTTNVFTNTEDINANLSGGTLVTKGQNFSFANDGTSSMGKVQTNSEQNINSVSSMGQTASEREFKQMGQTASGSDTPKLATESKQSASLNINLIMPKY